MDIAKSKGHSKIVDLLSNAPSRPTEEVSTWHILHGIIIVDIQLGYSLCLFLLQP